MLLSLIMKALFIFSIFVLSVLTVLAQNRTRLPHGMTFGKKVDTTANLPATKVEAFMDKKIRISTTITGKVLKVTKTKGGWFDLDAGQGKIIKAHFKEYDVTIPTALKGRTVTIQGVAQKQFIADDMQHFAGDTIKGKKQHHGNANPKQRLTFEVAGLTVD